jgi:predicted metalloprotease with PDZ domain
MLQYRLQPKNPAAHLFEVSVTVDVPDAAGQRFLMPVWIPGSYMIREFARHVVTLRAACNGVPVACTKIDKATWQCEPVTAPLTVTYEVYAWELSVRGAHLDDTHAFFNGACVFLLPLGHEQDVCRLKLLAPEAAALNDWQVATSLPRHSADQMGFGLYQAANYDELIDHPVEMGTFSHATFDVQGVTHHVVITGRTRADLPRLCADLQKICSHQARLFEPVSGKPPVAEYWFLITATGDGYGGLEHRASTALLCSRDELPLSHQAKVTDGYRRFLGLASHEYFHTWNVKRITPSGFVAHDLTREAYTRDLWFFEGITSYYDDLSLVRAGIIDELSYLELMAEHVGRLSQVPGRKKQSLSEASFDAWIKYYRADENAPNSQVSYYLKGALIGFALDANIRIQSRGEYSLDDVMRALWERYGKLGVGVEPGAIESLVAEVTHLNLTAFFDQALRGTDDPDFAGLLNQFAIDLSWRARAGRASTEPPESWLGAKVGARNSDAVLEQVFDGGPAQLAGLAAGDAVIAIDGIRINGVSLERKLRTYPVGVAVNLTAFRRDELMTFKVVLQPQPPSLCVLTTLQEPAERAARRKVWLGIKPA